MRNLNTAIAGFEAAATLRPGLADRDSLRLKAGEPQRDHGTALSVTKH